MVKPNSKKLAHKVSSQMKKDLVVIAYILSVHKCVYIIIIVQVEGCKTHLDLTYIVLIKITFFLWY